MADIEAMTSEDLVRTIRAAHQASDAATFRALTEVLLRRHEHDIAREIYHRLSVRGMLSLREDAAASIQQRVLEHLRDAKPKSGMTSTFLLYLRGVCRDVIDPLLRGEGLSIWRRGQKRGVVAERPTVIPSQMRLSIDAPLTAVQDDVLTLGDTIADTDSTVMPEQVVLAREERLEQIRSLSPQQRQMVQIYTDLHDNKLTKDAILEKYAISRDEFKQRYNEALALLTAIKEK